MEYRAASPLWLTGGIALPRVLFQAAFLVLVADLAGDRASTRFAFVGATAYVLTLPALQYAGMRYGRARWEGTLTHVKMSRWPAVPYQVMRCWPQVLEGLFYTLTVVLVVGSAFGHIEMADRLLATMPIYALIAGSLMSFGACLVVLTPKGKEVVVLNLAAAVILVLGGVVVPVSALPAGEWVTNLLPLTHGLNAIRGAVDGGLMAPHVAGEALVGASWLIAAVLLDSLTTRVQRKTGRGYLHA